MLFYIIETELQLNELINKDYKKVFIEPIYFNNNFHPSQNSISLLYLKPLNNDKGYLICINHNETLSLNKTLINALLNQYEEVYLRDRKAFIYHFPIRNIIDISFEIPECIDPSNNTYDFFYQKYSNLENINTIIPITKHYEKCELIFENIKKYCFKNENERYQNKLTSSFFYIEKNGIKIDKKIFDKYFEPTNEKYSISNNKINTQYNLHTTTGRPSNSFNGINFAALKKDDGCRKAFIPENDYFIEIDISSYHPTLAGQCVCFDFGDETPYQYFSREANIPLDEAKILMFKQLYGGIYKEYKNIEYFKLIQRYVDDLWGSYESIGEIVCSRSGHKFTKNLKDMNPQKLFNYLLQNLETSTNVYIIWDIINVLKGKNTKIVMYLYDSILIDTDENEEVLIQQTLDIFYKYNFKVKVKKGLNYHDMLLLE
jgi:hypothetical protein